MSNWFRIAGVDTETTDLDVEKGAKIIEIAFCVYKTDGTRFVHEKTFNKRIHPGAGVAINPKAQAVHGISLDMLEGAPLFADVAKPIAALINQCSLLVAHNMEFDAVFMATEMANAGVDLPDIQTFCTMEEGRLATGMGKLPNLGELCFAFDVDYDPSAAHAADYDINCTMKAFVNGVKSGFFKLPVEAMEVAA